MRYVTLITSYVESPGFSFLGYMVPQLLVPRDVRVLDRFKSDVTTVLVVVSGGLFVQIKKGTYLR